jgi:tRNA(Arg) A34 adenosine deaminase TadA
MSAAYRASFMHRAIELSARALDEPGTEPFGAVVVIEGRIVGEGYNHAAAHHDPTAHGEVEAIRDACRRLQRLNLEGATLYSSCEPCALCVAAMHLVGIRRLYYGTSLAQSDAKLASLPEARRRTIDSSTLRREAGLELLQREMPCEQHQVDQALAVLSNWAAQAR